jgi:exonuclease VII large subunit
MIPATARRIIDTNRVRLDNPARNIPLVANNLMATQRTRLERAIERIGDNIARAMQREQQRLQALDDKATLLSPAGTLRRGYSLVKLGDRYISTATDLHPGDQVTLQFAADDAQATIN